MVAAMLSGLAASLRLVGLSLQRGRQQLTRRWLTAGACVWLSCVYSITVVSGGLMLAPGAQPSQQLFLDWADCWLRWLLSAASDIKSKPRAEPATVQQCFPQPSLS